MLHVPVLLEESLDFLLHNLSGSYLDLTFGRGSHSQEILKDYHLMEHLMLLIETKMQFCMGKSISMIHALVFIIQIILKLILLFSSKQFDGIILDLGTCSTHLDDSNRGFSFQANGPLDMRMDTSSGFSASEWLNNAPEKRLVIFYINME